MQTLPAYSNKTTYSNIDQLTWDELIAELKQPYVPPVTVHLPIQPVHSPDFVHVDCAFNAIRRRVHPRLSFRERDRWHNLHWMTRRSYPTCAGRACRWRRDAFRSPRQSISHGICCIVLNTFACRRQTKNKTSCVSAAV